MYNSVLNLVQRFGFLRNEQFLGYGIHTAATYDSIGKLSRAARSCHGFKWFVFETMPTMPSALKHSPLSLSWNLLIVSDMLHPIVQA
jgi:hypothetical protein